VNATGLRATFDPANVHKVIADLVPYLEPGLLPKNFPSAFSKSPEPIDHIVSMGFDHNLVPSGARGVNLRMLAAQPRGNEARYAINRYFRERGDAKFRSVHDMLAMPMFSGSLDNLKRAFSDTATTLDTPDTDGSPPANADAATGDPSGYGGK
jgi:hypothetical protein